jgi:hypothetical protein
VNTLNLVLANDGVLKSTAVLHEKDSVLVSTLSLTSALSATAIGLHATIEGARDLLGLLVGDGALGGGDRKGGALAKGEDVVGSGLGRAGGSEAGDGSNDGDGELHFDSWSFGTLRSRKRNLWKYV